MAIDEKLGPEFYRLQNFEKKLERERIEALSNWNPIKYFSLCEQLGKEPESQLLYEQGYVEVNYKK